MLGMISTIHGRGSTFPDHVLDAVSGERRSDKRIARHAANLIRQIGVGKQIVIRKTVIASS
jgi:hypothetical protein